MLVRLLCFLPARTERVQLPSPLSAGTNRRLPGLQPSKPNRRIDADLFEKQGEQVDALVLMPEQLALVDFEFFREQLQAGHEFLPVPGLRGTADILVHCHVSLPAKDLSNLRREARS